MQSDLALLCRDARARIDVPAVPLTAIRSAAALPRPRKLAWLAALVAGISIVAVATAAVLATHIAFDRTGNMVQISSASLKMKFANPTAADVDAAVHGANFPVTLPAGLPSGTKLKALWSSDGAIMLLYDLPGAWRASHHVAWILLANPSTVVSSDAGGRMRVGFARQGKPNHCDAKLHDISRAHPHEASHAQASRPADAVRGAELPKTRSGKIRRVELRQLERKGATRASGYL
jgi:acyl-CoA synthetase (AMP-forming)/AMP-acid ligase II